MDGQDIICSAICPQLEFVECKAALATWLLSFLALAAIPSPLELWKSLNIQLKTGYRTSEKL